MSDWALVYEYTFQVYSSSLIIAGRYIRNRKYP